MISEGAGQRGPLALCGPAACRSACNCSRANKLRLSLVSTASWSAETVPSSLCKTPGAAGPACGRKGGWSGVGKQRARARPTPQRPRQRWATSFTRTPSSRPAAFQDSPASAPIHNGARSAPRFAAPGSPFRDQECCGQVFIVRAGSAEQLARHVAPGIGARSQRPPRGQHVHLASICLQPIPRGGDSARRTGLSPSKRCAMACELAAELGDRIAAASQVNQRPRALPFGTRALQRHGRWTFACAPAGIGAAWATAPCAPDKQL